MRPLHPDTLGGYTTVPNEDGSLSVFDAAGNHRMNFQPNGSFRYDAPRLRLPRPGGLHLPHDERADPRRPPAMLNLAALPPVSAALVAAPSNGTATVYSARVGMADF